MEFEKDMRLKDILLEDYKRDTEKALELDSILTGEEFKNDMETLFYRGESSRKVKYFETRSIRKDRKPKDTPIQVQKLIDVIGEYQYPNVPKRSESKYAASNLGEARAYGDPHVVFPEKDANVVSFLADTFNYLPGIKGFRACTHFLDEDVTELPPNDRILAFRSDLNANDYIKKFVVGCAYLFKKETVPGMLRDVFKSIGIEKMISEFRRFKNIVEKDEEPSQDYDHRDETFAKIIIQVLQDIDGYYNRRLRRNNHSSSSEIMFDGDSYLLVNYDFFSAYFQYVEGKWKVKDHVKR